MGEQQQISRYPGGVIALSERLRRYSSKIGNCPHGADLRLASIYLRAYATLLIAEAADRCVDPKEHDALLHEVLQLRRPLQVVNPEPAGPLLTAATSR